MNWNTFKEMSFKKKLQWLVQYYGVVALVGLIVIFVLGYLIKSIISPEPIADVCVIILSDEIYTEEAIEMQYELSKSLECTFDVRTYNISDPYAMQSFATRVMTDQLDIVIAPLSETKELQSNSYISDYEVMDDIGTCISVPVKARKNSAQEYAVDYFKKRFENK